MEGHLYFRPLKNLSSAFYVVYQKTKYTSLLVLLHDAIITLPGALAHLTEPVLYIFILVPAAHIF